MNEQNGFYHNNSTDIFIKALVAFLGFWALSIVILSWVPPVSRDALTHHLAVPKLYLERGEIYHIPSHEFSYYPMNLELLYMIPLYWGNDILPKLIHYIFALFTAAIIYVYLKKRMNTVYALVGATFFLSVPVIVKLATTVYVDLGLTFFSTASLFYLIKWIENRFKIGFLAISAIFCGLALGTKYNGLLVLALIALLIPFVYSRQSGGGVSNTAKSIGFGLVFILIALTIFSPWMIRNYRWTQNPVYPLYRNWFKTEKAAGKLLHAEAGKKPTVVALVKQNLRPTKRLNHLSYRKEIYRESWWEIALVPFRIFFQGEDDQPRYFDGRLNPFLFFLPFFAFLGLRGDSAVIKTEKWVWASFVVLYLLISFFYTVMRIRYIAPAIPPLVILSVFGLNRICTIISEKNSGNEKKSNVVLATITMFCLALNTLYLVEQFKWIKPMSYLTGELSRDRYIERYRGEYPAYQFVNRNLPGNVKIARFFLGNRIYYCDRETISGTGLFYFALKRFETSHAVSAHMKKRGITHLLIRKDLFHKFIVDNLEAKKQKIVDDLFRRHVHMLFDKNGYSVFQLI
ncbi:ArnT family glycosyltransferase [Thermodesulfobacteriota bacterium]